MSGELDGMGRVLNFIRGHQRRGGTSRLSAHKIAAAVGLSPKHVTRLKRTARERGLLIADEDKLSYKRIAVEEARKDRRWIPRTTCCWDKPIVWQAADGEGEWISAKQFSLRPRGEIWMVAFIHREHSSSDYPPRFGPGVIAFVRPLKDPTDARVGDWCLVTYKRQVRSMFRVAGRGFRRPAEFSGVPPEIDVSAVTHVAVIEAVHIPCTRSQNKIRLRASEIVSVVGASPVGWHPSRRGAGVVCVDAVRLRRALQKKRKVLSQLRNRYRSRY